MARRFKMAHIENNPFFSIRGLKYDALHSPSVAPGIDVSYILTFTPQERVDYSYNLECVTEREKFLVPIQAIGVRGIH